MRRGFALPAVLGTLLLLVPVVFALALRSHQQLMWHQKLEDQARAALLAEEGEALVRLELRNGGTATTGTRPLPTGSVQWRIDSSLPYGDDGQRRVFFAGEGIHHGEERLMVGFIEVFTGGPEPMLIASDREWIVSKDGGSLTDLNALKTAHQQSVDRYLSQLVLENGRDPAQFVRVLKDQSYELNVQHVKDSWTAIAAALGRAKCQVN